MSTVAKQIREAREARNLTIEQVAEITKMRTDHVRALEDGDYKAFSAPVYLRGFVRTYARLLKLEEAPLLTALQQEMGDMEDPQGVRQASSPKGLIDVVALQLSRVDFRKGLILMTAAVLLVAGIVGVVAWQKARTEDPLKDLKPGVYQPSAPTTEILPLGK